MPVTVCGALTANTGAGLAFGGAVLSLEKLNKIDKINKINNESFSLKNGKYKGETAQIKVGAGARVGDIKKSVLQAGFFYPPDPTEQTSMIGGNISTNASGARGFKFGPTRDYIKSLKIIFTDGSEAKITRGINFADDKGVIVFDTDKGKKQIVLPKYNLPKIKNAAGYFNYPNADLIDIFIGSEGTLGIIIEAELLLLRNFKNIFGAIVFFDNDKKLFDFVESAKKNLNAMSLEYFDKNTLDFVREFYPQIPHWAEGAIMFEQDVYDGDDEEKLINNWIENIANAGADDASAWFAQNTAEMERFRVFRHKIPEKANEIVHRNGIPKAGTDFAVPEGKIKEILDFCRREFDESKIMNLIFGHIGENHIHANIFPKNQEEFDKTRKIYEKIVQKVIDLDGTASAEHGIGKVRHIFLEKMVGRNGFYEMSKLKKSLDEAEILGLDNIFPKL
jgi:D-lactate dehydrogenase (cytochrome)